MPALPSRPCFLLRPRLHPDFQHSSQTRCAFDMPSETAAAAAAASGRRSPPFSLPMQLSASASAAALLAAHWAPDAERDGAARPVSLSSPSDRAGGRVRRGVHGLPLLPSLTVSSPASPSLLRLLSCGLIVLHAKMEDLPDIAACEDSYGVDIFVPRLTDDAGMSRNAQQLQWLNIIVKRAGRGLDEHAMDMALCVLLERCRRAVEM